MSNVEPQVSPEANSPVRKGYGKSKGKKLGKQKTATTEVEHIYSGRIEALRIVGHDDKSCAIVFSLKGKKNGMVQFSVLATDAARFNAMSSLLNMVLIKDLIVKVVSLSSGTGEKVDTELSALL